MCGCAHPISSAQQLQTLPHLSKTSFRISRIPGEVALLPSLPAMLTQPILMQTQGSWECLEGRLGWPKGAPGKEKVPSHRSL